MPPSSSSSRQVWVRDPDQAWVAATVTDEGDITAAPRAVRFTRNIPASPEESATVDESGDGPTLKTRNLFDDDNAQVRGYDAVHDLTRLTHLHEPEILEALQVRFARNQIYTNTGPILLAVNPFKPLSIYGAELLATYYSAGLLRSQSLESPTLPPHVYAIADAAYRNLMDSPGGPMDQSILVSGESGAGKTETTKFVMSYLATVARSDATHDDHVADRVLESNPILESFGNARTMRNDNSSRFGKFIQMAFDAAAGKLVGAQIATYLLEKVRLAQQGPGERNFHVFYQMMAGASAEDRTKWRLPASPAEARYTNQSKVYDRRDGVLDDEQFARTETAIAAMRFSPDERNDMYRVAAAVLQLGNVTFQGEEAVVSSPDSLESAAYLFGVSSDALSHALSTRSISTMGETFVKKLNEQDAVVSRDALAKTAYSRLFDWIVRRVNSAVAHTTGAAGNGNSKQLHKKTNFIAVLDIFGFEVFAVNSFEQLCINYANETLQQQFNQFVFELEQKEYEREAIAWAFIDFPNNKACLDLIEGKPTGILALLDEQCLFPKGNDESFAGKLYEILASKEGSLLTVSKAERVAFKFVVKHYAGDVVYTSAGFCSKNKDELRPEALSLMRSSTFDLVLRLFPAQEQGSPPQQGKRAAGGSLQSATVGSQFKGQLAELLKTIKATAPHYVRCLKPNDANVADTFVRGRMVDQLRYGGVLEAVKVARAGYPTRFALRDFVRRYFMLVGSAQSSKKPPASDDEWRQVCSHVVSSLGLEQGAAFQIGKTKVFLRKHAYERLETQRSLVLKASAIKGQAAARMFLCRRRYARVHEAGRLLQRTLRGMLGRRRAQDVRRQRAAIRLQRAVRAFCARRHLARALRCVLLCQALVRGRRGRVAAREARRTRAATTCQCFWRRAWAMRVRTRARHAVVRLQRLARVFVARRALRRLRIEAREVGGLQRKVEELQRRLLEAEARARPEVYEPAQKKHAAAEAVPPALEDEREQEYQRKVAVLEDQLETARRRISTLERDLVRVEAERDSLTALVTTAPEDDNKVEQLASSLVVLQQERAKIALERDSLVAVVSAEDELAQDRDRLQAKLLAAEKRLERLADLDRLALRVEELEGANQALRESLNQTPDLRGFVVVDNEGRSTVTHEAFANVVAERDRLAELVHKLEAQSPSRQGGSKSAAAKLFDKLVPMQATREGQLMAQSKELEKERAAQETAKNKALEQLMNATNECNNKDVLIRRLQREIGDLKEKAEAMDQLAEQTSGVKIALARRLEGLILENKALKASIAELSDQLAATQDISRVLNEELENKFKDV